MATGQCVRRFDSAHTQGVTSLALSADSSHVLSTSYDGLIRWVAVRVREGGAGSQGAARPLDAGPVVIAVKCLCS